MKPSNSHFHLLRGVRLHVREWGEPGAPQLFCLHGWGDVSASFQFVVDALQRDWHVIAPDWRGFGLSEGGCDTYWFPDYLGDLEALLNLYASHGKVRLVGHSLGGNVACVYAGVRPNRVSDVIALDAFGLPDTGPDAAPGRFEKWLNQLSTPEDFPSYPNVAAFAHRLMRANPRLDADKAAYLATHLSRPDGKGGVIAALDGAHRHVSALPYRRAEAEYCWRRVRARMCWIVQADPDWRRRLGVSDALYESAVACFADFTEIEVSECGHNLHHDQPHRVAALIESFLAAG